MKKLYGYIRVSTKKQDAGVSLEEQKSAIKSYAQKEGYLIVRFFEEKVTAAKEGRPEFNKMMRLLLKKSAEGVVMHKVDRSSRNFGDWHKIGKLVDSNIDVFYAHSNTDLSKQSDRLSADIELVMAANYIRNLRSEVKKGFYGRLKQGILPLPAPVGYLNEGSGKPKSIDPHKAPLIKKAFELYSTGNYSLKELCKKMAELGLKNRNGKNISFTHLSKILNNPYYYGLIKIAKTDEIFKGVHEPIVSKQLYNKVQGVLKGKTPRRVFKHDFAFRRLIKCIHCKYSLIGELKKGNVYYRCHTKTCQTKTIREDRLAVQLCAYLDALSLNTRQQSDLRNRADEISILESRDSRQSLKTLNLLKASTESKLDLLTDSLLDGVVDETTYQRKKNQMNERLLEYEAGMTKIRNCKLTSINCVEQFLELLETVTNNTKDHSNHILREMVCKVTSNIFLDGESVAVQPLPPFDGIIKTENIGIYHYGEQHRGEPRTLVYLKDLKLKNNKMTKGESESFIQKIVSSQTH